MEIIIYCFYSLAARVFIDSKACSCLANQICKLLRDSQRHIAALPRRCQTNYKQRVVVCTCTKWEDGIVEHRKGKGSVSVVATVAPVNYQKYSTGFLTKQHHL